MPTALSDADKVLRNDTGKDIVDKLDDIAQALGVGAPASNVIYDNTESGLTADNVQEAVDELASEKADKSEFTLNTTSDTTPYLYKASEYDAVYDKLVGGTVAFNQLLENNNFATTTNWLVQGGGSFTISNGIATVTYASNSDADQFVHNCNQTSGHKFLTMVQLKQSVAVSGLFLAGGSNTKVKESVATTDWQTLIGMYNNPYSYWILRNKTSEPSLTVQVKNPCIIDLTQMFGTTIADYIYSLEQATTGAGVAFFKKLFPKSYYAYNAGELMSVKTSKHITVGFNQWDEEWESGAYNIYGASGTGAKINASGYTRTKNFIPAFPNTTYHMHRPHSGNQLYIGFYDADKNWLGYSSKGVVWNLTEQEINFTTSENTHYMVFYDLGDIAGTCLNLSDTSLNGQYKPYVKTEYALYSNLELRGIPKLDTNNKLYYDGDIYVSDGNVTRKYAKVVFDGSVSTGWQYSGEYGTSLRFNYSNSSIKPNSFNIISSRFPYHIVENNAEGVSTHSQSSMIILEIAASKLNGATVADLMTYFSSNPLTVVYELSTPTTENSTPFANPQTLYSKGTEEYIDERDVAIPVGGDRTYVDIPDWMQNRYFDDIRSESSLVPEISNEVSHKAEQKDLTDIFVTGTKNNTGSTITAGTYFYVNNQLALCKQAISANADLTLNTNYELVTAGVLNELMPDINTLTQHVGNLRAQIITGGTRWKAQASGESGAGNPYSIMIFGYRSLHIASAVSISSDLSDLYEVYRIGTTLILTDGVLEVDTANRQCVCIMPNTVKLVQVTT